MLELSYYIALALFFCHELDAVRKSEWRILYVLRSKSNSKARWWFVALHFPLLLIVFWTIGSDHFAGEIGKVCLASLCVIHSLIHFRLRMMGKCPFVSTGSKYLIDLSGIAALAFIMLYFAQSGTAT